jgi:cation-transporting ATPase E
VKDILLIIRRNFASPIVIAILVLALTLLMLGQGRDAWFISFVILFNTLLAIVQEIRARQALKKLELMSAPRARRQKSDGTYDEVMYDQLVTGDSVRLQTGDEVPADGTLTESSGLEVDESMLTGESLPIEKAARDVVYAASTVVAGGAMMHVTAVGSESKAGVMTSSLKRYTPQLTPLQHAISRAITFLTYGALALAALIFVVYSLSGTDAVRIFKTITSAAVTIVPEGLLLASSLLLAFGSLKLAQARVLPQKLAAIEAMAVLSVLCVDKTGTLTSDTVTFEALELFEKVSQKEMAAWREQVGIAARATSGGNATGEAMITALDVQGVYEIKDTLAFSSARKMSGVRMSINGETHTLFMGAPEFLGKLAPLTLAQKKQIDSLAGEGKRVLLIAESNDQKTPLKKLATAKAVGIVVLGNALRKGVQDTVAYLQKNGVSMRVISGDSPKTVQYIAQQAGIKHSNRVITGAELATLSDADWRAVVEKTTIFARVLPEQKERLIATFKESGEFTGMVGDGVNDALALKKADLGVAMYAGAAASRRVADIVLLDNSFTSLPMGMHLGNRIMQAIELIAVLFFHKIIYGVLLLLSTLALGMRFPFEPRHVTFMNIFLVTLPTIMWTLFPPKPKHKVQPQHFWRDTLLAVTPIALISGLAVTATYWLVAYMYPRNHEDVATTTLIVATFFGIYLVILASKILGVVDDFYSRMARLLYVGAACIVAVLSFGVRFIRDFFSFTSPSLTYIWPTLLIVLVAALIQYRLADMAGKRLKQKNYNV